MFIDHDTNQSQWYDGKDAELFVEHFDQSEEAKDLSGHGSDNSELLLNVSKSFTHQQNEDDMEDTIKAYKCKRKGTDHNSNVENAKSATNKMLFKRFKLHRRRQNQTGRLIHNSPM